MMAACACGRRRSARSNAPRSKRCRRQPLVNIADALEIVQQVVDQIALVIRFLSGFAILAGAVILAASVAGTRFRRVREVVILKTLGATRHHIVRIFSVEFLTLGVVAGLMGAILATVFSSLLLKRLLSAHFQFDPKATLLAVALTAPPGQRVRLAREPSDPRTKAVRSFARRVARTCKTVNLGRG